MSGTPHYKRTRLGGTRFTELPDAPSSLDGKAGSVPMVIAGENKMEFYSLAAGDGFVVDIDHTTKIITLRLASTFGITYGAQTAVGVAALAGAAPSISVSA